MTVKSRTEPVPQVGQGLLWADLVSIDRDHENSLVSSIVITIAEDIIEGRLLPGDSLESSNLAKRFQTSRTPVREALIALEKESLIELPPRRRAYITHPDLQKVTEIYELRAVLHGLVCRKAAKNASEGGISKLSHLADRMSKAAATDRVDDFFWANVEFHVEIMRVADDSTLRRTLQGLGLQVLRLRRLSMSSPGRIQRSASDHQRLVLAVAEHDHELAGVMSSSIILDALKTLKDTGAVPIRSASIS